MLSGRQLLRVCLASALWAFGFGVGMQVISHWLHQRGLNDELIGYVQASYYLGLALTSLAVPMAIRRWGSSCTAIGMLGAGLTLAAYPWTGSPFGWFALRLLNGAAGALSLIPLETMVSRDSAKEHRARNFACYAVALTLGGALGIGVGLAFIDPTGAVAAILGDRAATWAFCLGGAAPVLGAALLGRGYAAVSSREEGTGTVPRPGGRQRFLSYGTAWGQGFLEGGMLAFLSLYLVATGFSAQEAGVLMGVTMVGVILFQVPAGWLAGRWGNTRTLLLCYGVVIGGLVLVPWLQISWQIGLCLFLFGACSGAMYPLGLALLGDNLPNAMLARAYARYMALECVGSQMGAAAMGLARDKWGGAAMFGVAGVAVGAVVVVWSFLPKRAPAVPSEISDAPTRSAA